MDAFTGEKVKHSGPRGVDNARCGRNTNMKVFFNLSQSLLEDRDKVEAVKSGYRRKPNRVKKLPRGSTPAKCGPRWPSGAHPESTLVKFAAKLS